MRKMTLGEKRIDIWRARLNVENFEMNVLKCLLSGDEQNRANSYKFFEPRKLFTLTRVRLRQILSFYTGIEPERHIFNYNPQGKPELPHIPGIGKISFNLSHSGDMSVFAFTLNHQVGIDIEKPDRKIEIEKVAKKYFLEREYETIMSLPEPERIKAFYNCWTRKEAYIKGKGTGIAQLLEKVEVSCVPGEPVKLLANGMDPGDVYKWTIENLDIVPPYVGAIAYEGRGMEMKYYTF